MIRKISAYPSVLQGAALEFEPHRMTYYLQQLAAGLHMFYNKHRILPPAGDNDMMSTMPKGEKSTEARQKEELTPQRTAGRLALMRGVEQVLKNGLGMLGVSAPAQM